MRAVSLALNNRRRHLDGHDGHTTRRHERHVFFGRKNFVIENEVAVNGAREGDLDGRTFFLRLGVVECQGGGPGWGGQNALADKLPDTLTGIGRGKGTSDKVLRIDIRGGFNRNPLKIHGEVVSGWLASTCISHFFVFNLFCEKKKIIVKSQ
jgi:hypothetical protein